MSDLKRTVLYNVHVAAGATMVDFGGWDMPVQYPSGIVAEHLYTRSSYSLFDVSHMGRMAIEGPQRLEYLQYVLTSNVAALKMIRFCWLSMPPIRMISQISQAIANGITAEQLMKAMRPHPTFEEAVSEALEELIAKLNK